MNNKKLNLLAALVLIMLPTFSFGQNDVATSVNSITGAEIRNHIFFLASDYLGGRVATSPQYDIAANYVASQFAEAGLVPVIEQENGSKSWFQPVPFAKTKYSGEVEWVLNSKGKRSSLWNNKEYKILFANNVNFSDLEMIFVGFGIEEPDHGWNDLKGLSTEGKILVCLTGTPEKKGSPVLPPEVNGKYTSMTGLQSKVMKLLGQGAAGIIIVDVNGSSGIPFDNMPSEFNTERFNYMGEDRESSRGTIPSIYLARPEVLNTILQGAKYNPMNDRENLMKNYRTFDIEDVTLSSKVEELGSQEVITRNVIGMVPGTDPDLKDEYIVVGAHLDHVGPANGEVCNGADDNASGSSGVMEIAEAVAANPCRRSVLFIAYTAEEMGLYGSRHFVSSGAFPKENIRFNINLDMIGRSSAENEGNRSHYVVTDKKYLTGIESFINEINNGVTDFSLLYDNDDDSPGGSDHQSFINQDIPAFFFFSGIYEDLHAPGDDPEKIDYSKAESLSRLAYLITNRLANMDEVPSFLEE